MGGAPIHEDSLGGRISGHRPVVQFYRIGHLAGVKMSFRGSQFDAILEGDAMIRLLSQYSQHLDHAVVQSVILHHPRHDAIELIVRERLAHEPLQFGV